MTPPKGNPAPGLTRGLRGCHGAPGQARGGVIGGLGRAKAVGGGSWLLRRAGGSLPPDPRGYLRQGEAGAEGLTKGKGFRPCH
jgi:hypothetical protein